MTSFVIDESVLERLSPEARRELLRLLKHDIMHVTADFADTDWDPEGELSYPMSVDEAKALVRGQSKAPREMLRVFCLNTEGDTGTADLKSIMKATGQSRYKAIGDAVATITQRLRTVTGDQDAWLFNWRPDDWQWNEKKKTYTKGAYFISGPAIHTLRTAFGISE